MNKLLLTLLALTSVAFAQTKSVSPTGGGLNATDNPAFRTALGGTTIGQNVFTLANPSAITFPRFNADNTISPLTASDFRTAIGGTTIGQRVFTLTNPSAITFPRFNADNTVSSLSATDFRNAIGAGTSSFTLSDSASLAAALSNETGTGLAVFGTSPTLTTPVINVTSDATGDIYYRSAGGLFTRLPIGTNGQLLSVSGGGLPSWSTLSIPSVEVTLAGAEVLTNKTLSTGTVFTSGPTMTLGSDGTGDIYYRNAGGVLTRLGAGTNGHVLTLNAGLPAWVAAGGGLTNWTDSISTAAPNATIPVASFTATNAATNVDAAIRPKGTGAILVSIPDATVAGGNKRGSNAVDLQFSRNNAAQVASGTNSVIAGGTANTASGTSAAVIGGTGNTSQGFYAFSGGHLSSATANGSFAYGYSATASSVAAISLGQDNVASGENSSVLGGRNNTSSGNFAVVIGGRYNVAAGEASVASGNSATTRTTYGAHARSSGQIAVVGDAQVVNYILRKVTTDDTANIELTANAAVLTSTNIIALPNDSVYSFEGTIAARASASDAVSVWKVSGVIKRGANAAATAIVGTVTIGTPVQDAGAATWAVSIDADTTNGSLRVRVTGAAATNISWIANIETEQLVY